VRKHTQIYIKLLLIIFAEAIAMAVNHGISRFIHPIEHKLTITIVVGTILAMVVVWMYDRRLKKKKQRVEKELQDLTDVVLKKVPDQQDNEKRK